MVDMNKLHDSKDILISTKNWPLYGQCLTEYKDKQINHLIENCKERLKVSMKYSSFDMGEKDEERMGICRHF